MVDLSIVFCMFTKGYSILWEFNSSQAPLGMIPGQAAGKSELSHHGKSGRFMGKTPNLGHRLNPISISLFTNISPSMEKS